MLLQTGSKVDFYVDCEGQVRRHLMVGMPEEQSAQQGTGDRSKLPEHTSDQILAAPARDGRTAAFADYSTVSVGSEGQEVVEVRYPKGRPVRERDIFDKMAEQGGRRSRQRAFTDQEIGAGRDYRAVHMKVEAMGVKCSSLWQQPRRSGKTDVIDAFIQNRRRLDMFHEAIGHGVAKRVKNKVPVREGKVIIGKVTLRSIGRKLITVRTLVDSVCLYEEDIASVLERHGWARGGKNQVVLRKALADALYRMQGIGAG
jgi:hypothetical protein